MAQDLRSYVDDLAYSHQQLDVDSIPIRHQELSVAEPISTVGKDLSKEDGFYDCKQGSSEGAATIQSSNYAASSEA